MRINPMPVYVKGSKPKKRVKPPTDPLIAQAMEKGTDEQFLDWIRRQPSCISKQWSECVDGVLLNPACHVRRVANGAGTSQKPPYSAVPMLHLEHDIQTNHGEAACLNTFHKTKGWTEATAKHWFNEQRMIYLKQWLEEGA